MNTQKNKHMSLEDRIEIEECLRHGMTFKQIGTQIGKDQTTVSKEIKKHITVVKSYDPNKAPCTMLLKAPFVCNGCKKRTSCRLEKHLYRAKDADKQYREMLSDSRTGIALNKQSFYRADEILYDGVKNKGQHIYHIAKSHDLGMSVSSVYRNINKGYLSVGRIDLPRAVKFKERKSRANSEYVPKSVKVGHTYEDFLTYIKENDISHWVEMDTVIGRIGGKVALTLDFTECNFMVALLLDDKTAAEASRKFQAMKKNFSSHGKKFQDIIPLLLTDNGGEFSNIRAFMDDADGNSETALFFCDPYKSSEKPKVEKNHTLFRDICPKGTSFDSFTQQDLNFIFSHVNSVKRKRFNNKSPYELFTFLYGEDCAEIFGISKIPEQDVCQSPMLLKRLPSISKE